MTDVLKVWCENYKPIFEEIYQKLESKYYNDNEETKDGNIANCLGYYWKFFHKNSNALLAMCAVENIDFYWQILGTLRFFLEMAADISFMLDYPENFDSIVEKSTNMDKKRKDKTQEYTFRDAAHDIHNIKLYEYKNGKKIDQKYKSGKKKGDGSTSSTERIELAFSNPDFFVEAKKVYDDISDFYEFSSAHVHFNFQTIVWSINENRSENVNYKGREWLDFWQYAFAMMVYRIGKFAGLSEEKIHGLINQSGKYISFIQKAEPTGII